jgi:hypothetical protein
MVMELALTRFVFGLGKLVPVLLRSSQSSQVSARLALGSLGVMDALEYVLDSG